MPEDPLGLTFMMEEGSENLALDLQDIRLMLEPETCAIVARGATPEQIDQMQAYCDEVTRLIEAEEDYSATQSSTGILPNAAETMCCPISSRLSPRRSAL